MHYLIASTTGKRNRRKNYARSLALFQRRTNETPHATVKLYACRGSRAVLIASYRA